MRVFIAYDGNNEYIPGTASSFAENSKFYLLRYVIPPSSVQNREQLDEYLKEKKYSIKSGEVSFDETSDGMDCFILQKKDTENLHLSSLSFEDEDECIENFINPLDVSAATFKETMKQVLLETHNVVKGKFILG